MTYQLSYEVRASGLALYSEAGDLVGGIGKNSDGTWGVKLSVGTAGPFQRTNYASLEAAKYRALADYIEAQVGSP